MLEKIKAGHPPNDVPLLGVYHLRRGIYGLKACCEEAGDSINGL